MEPDPVRIGDAADRLGGYPPYEISILPRLSALHAGGEGRGRGPRRHPERRYRYRRQARQRFAGEGTGGHQPA